MSKIIYGYLSELINTENKQFRTDRWTYLHPAVYDDGKTSRRTYSQYFFYEDKIVFDMYETDGDDSPSITIRMYSDELKIIVRGSGQRQFINGIEAYVENNVKIPYSCTEEEFFQMSTIEDLHGLDYDLFLKFRDFHFRERKNEG